MSCVVAMLCGDAEISTVTSRLPVCQSDLNFSDTTTFTMDDASISGVDYSNYISSSTGNTTDPYTSPANAAKPMLNDGFE